MRGAWQSNLTKVPLIYSASYFNLEGLSPPKPLHWRRRLAGTDAVFKIRPTLVVHARAWLMKLSSHARGTTQPVVLTPHTSGKYHAAGTDAVFKFCPTLVVHPTLLAPTPFPFKARAGHYSGRHFFGRNSPAAVVRELFKPSTDAASFLVSIQTKCFDLGLGFSWEEVTKWECFLIFDQLWLALGLFGASRRNSSPTQWFGGPTVISRPGNCAPLVTPLPMRATLKYFCDC